MLSPKIIALEEGWNNEIKAKAIDVLEDMLNTGLDKNKPRLFDPKEYVQTYTTCYNMCTQRSPYNWSEQLYQRHGETICDYLSKTVLPALKQAPKKQSKRDKKKARAKSVLVATHQDKVITSVF